MRFRYSILFILLWIFCLILYPSWLLPSSLIIRFILFASLISITLIGAFLLKTKFFPKTTKEVKLKEIFKDKYFLILLIACLIFILLHIPLMKLPITTGDEGYHISRGIWLIEPLNKISENFLHLSIFTIARILFIFIIVVFLIIYLFNLKEKFGKQLQKLKLFFKNKTFKKVYITLLVTIAFIYFFIVNKFASIYHLAKYGSATLDHLNWLIWYGPLGVILYAIQLIIFGYNEFGVRFIQPIFLALTAIYIFKLTNLFKNKKIALTSSLIFLFLPSIFAYGSVSLLDAGLVFFVTASIFYFLRYTKEGYIGDLLLSMFFFDLGFLYKNPILLLIPIYGLYLLITKNIKLEQIKIGVIGIIAIIPQFVLNKIFDPIHGSLPMSFFSNWKSFSDISLNFLLINKQATLIIFILFIMGLLYSIYLVLKEKDKFNTFLFIWFIVWYSAFVSYMWLLSGGIRLTLPYLPVVAILSAQILHKLLYIPKIKIINLIIPTLIIYLIGTSLFLNYSNYEDRSLPYDKMFDYIKENVGPNEKILAPMISPPYQFYIKKYDIKNEIIEKIWEPYDKQNLSNLYDYVKKNNISYVMGPMPEPFYEVYLKYNWTVVEYFSTCEEREKIEINGKKIPGCPFNKTLLRELEFMESGPFILEKYVILGNNKLILSKVNETFK